MINGEEFYSLNDKVMIVREALPKLSEIDNDCELREEVKKISEEIEISEEAILTELKRYRSGADDTRYTFIKLDSTPGNVMAEKFLIRCMLNDKEMAKKILRKMRARNFSVLLHRKIVRAIDRILEEDGEINSQNLIGYLPSQEAIKIIIDILMKEKIYSDEKVIFGFIDTVNNFRLLQEKKLKKRW